MGSPEPSLGAIIEITKITADILHKPHVYIKEQTSLLLRFSYANPGFGVFFVGSEAEGVASLSKMVRMAPAFRSYDLGTNPIVFAKFGLGATKLSSSK